ncbi:hypothetical protein FQN54_006804 [Arachnomyces sp. PD_36]|nr:hypothetical protein FQN54_006804 [Arachnomyces sp. PD_36]
MQLPEYLLGTYRRYKSDTSTLATWIAEEANRRGYKAGTATLLEEVKPAASQRLKGKARKEAKANGAINTSSASSAPRKRYKISLDDFVGVAEFIAGLTKPKVTPPPFVLRAALSAIKARERCSAWFRKKSSNDEALQRNNERHAHFISVLERVVEILKPCSAKGTEQELPKKSEAAVDSDLGETTTMFSLLQVEVPSIEDEDEVVQAPTAPTGQKPAKDKENAIYELDEPEDDVLPFVLFCFFEDVHHVGQIVRDIWAEYKAGKINLMTASVVTNTAIDLVRKTEDDMREAHPQFSAYWPIAEKMLGIIVSNQEADSSSSDIPEQPELEGINDYLHLSTYSILVRFRQNTQGTHFPMWNDIYNHTFSKKSRSSLSPAEKHKEDQATLLQTLPEICLLAKTKNPLPAEDELGRGIRKVIAGEKIYFWLVFAAQVFLDIHQLLGDEVDRGFNDLYKRAKNLKANLKAYFAFSRNMSIDTWAPQNQQLLHQTYDRINKWILKDGMAELRQSYGAPIATVETPPYKLLKNNPVLCGILAFQFTIIIQEAGIYLAGAWGSIIYPAHLYNAAQQQKQLDTPWKSMDYLIDLHGSSSVFAGNPPTDFEGYFRRATLMLGYSAEIYARNRRTNRGPVESVNGPKGLGEVSPVSNTFKDRICHYGNIDSCVATLETLLNEIAQGADPRTSHLRRQFPNRKLKLTTPQLLSLLRANLEKEAPGLTFNYILMHCQCIRLLRYLKSELDEALVRNFSEGYYENETHLPFIVMYTLMAAQKRNRVEGLLKKRIGPPDQGLFASASQALEQWLEKKPELGKYYNLDSEGVTNGSLDLASFYN